MKGGSNEWIRVWPGHESAAECPPVMHKVTLQRYFPQKEWGLSMVVYTFSPSIHRAEAGRSLRVQG